MPKGFRFLLCCLLAAASTGEGAPAPAASPPGVLLLFSLRSTAGGASAIEEAFRIEVERAFGGPVDTQIEYLDLSEGNENRHARSLVELLREKHSERRPAVVAVQGGPALRFLLENRETLFPGVPIVFLDVTRRNTAGVRLPEDATGVYLNLEGQRTVRVALDLHPQARRVVLIAGVASSDRASEAFARGLVEAVKPAREVVSLTGLPLDEQLKRVSQLSADSVVVFVSYRADSLGRSMVAREVLRLFTGASSVPVYGAVKLWLGLGIVGGDLIDYAPLGAKAAALTGRILRGERASFLPAEDLSPTELAFDARQLRRWGIEESRLPAGSVVLFREKTLWSEHGGTLLAATTFILVQFFLILALLVSRRRRDEAETRLHRIERKSEEELRTALFEVQSLRERLEAENTYLREQVEPEPGFGGIIGGGGLRAVLAEVQQVAATSSTVLLLGETGVGKELVAHAIHNLSPRRIRPLVKLDCAALPPSLIESELFGHERGAFTGAVALRKGRFEIADGSTLFLDEIGELPLALQPKLLRVIQDSEFERVGGPDTRRTDVRLIAATNRPLEQEVEAGRFRADLWYRLNVFPITLPPLRDRREDIPMLVQHFVGKHCRRLGRSSLQVSQATLRDLQAHSWPGNVRELEAVIERAVITSDGPSLRIEGRGPFARAVSREGGHAPRRREPGNSTTEGRSMTVVERDHILATLERTYWRLEGDNGAAALLGMNPSTLRSRMKKHGIRRPVGRLPENAPRREA